MTPIVNGLEAEFANRVAVIRLNAAAPYVVAQQTAYGVRGHPSFVVLDAHGQPQHRFLGPQSAETLRTAILSVAPPPK
ncbi:MAG: hypothetical protein Fur0021_14770 [Candidatus Promineifilaceae bacterium]